MRLLSVFFRSFSSSSSASLKKGDVVVLSAARTPIGAYGGSLSSLSSVQLGSTAIAAAIQRSGIDKKDISEVIMGNVISAGLGQAPATQAATAAGIANTVPSWSLNKVCSSGLKAFQLAAANIRSSDQSLVVAGGFESMSNIPFYSSRTRSAFPYGHQELIDGILRDGLMDAYEPNKHMGNCAEKCAAEYKITRQDQDAYALESYRRAVAAQKAGLFNNEIVPVIIKGRAGEVTVKDDEEPAKLKADKVSSLRPAFDKNGTVTAANASKINDGAAAFVLADAQWALSHGLKPIARVVSWADAQQAPVDFTTAPAIAIPLALKKAGLTIKDIDYFEINEAFSVVSIANNRILGLDPSRVNINGGAVALGHPIGGSGARIMVTLLNVLQQKGGKYGVAAICNGGGGATAVIVERL